MQPLSGTCSAAGGDCIPNPGTLRYDDIAALNRIYPITAASVANFPGKQITAANTVSIQGVITFRGGYGMQGVNVVARPLDANGNPLYEYTVTAVSGATFSGNHGNPVNGYTDSNSTPLTTWGSTDQSVQGAFDLSGMPLPPGVSAANYQVTFEAINPLYILTAQVGPYADGQVIPSGTLPTLLVPALAGGGASTLTVDLSDSASGGYQDAIGKVNAPRTMPGSGMWMGRISQVGQTDWFSFPVRGNRVFTIVTQALDETGAPNNSKAMPAIGVWDGFDPANANAVGASPGLNGLAPGRHGFALRPQVTTSFALALPTKGETAGPTMPTLASFYMQTQSHRRDFLRAADLSLFSAWAFGLLTRFSWAGSLLLLPASLQTRLRLLLRRQPAA
jgi:hypothetical protein